MLTLLFNKLFYKFFFIGLANTSINYIFFIIFITYNFSEKSSIACAYILSSISAFMLHKYFVFKPKRFSVLVTFIKYLLFLLLNLFIACINYFIFISFAKFVGGIRISYFFSISIVTIISFLCFKFFVFK